MPWSRSGCARLCAVAARPSPASASVLRPTSGFRQAGVVEVPGAGWRQDPARPSGRSGRRGGLSEAHQPAGRRPRPQRAPLHVLQAGGSVTGVVATRDAIAAALRPPETACQPAHPPVETGVVAVGDVESVGQLMQQHVPAVGIQWGWKSSRRTHSGNRLEGMVAHTHTPGHHPRSAPSQTPVLCRWCREAQKPFFFAFPAKGSHGVSIAGRGTRARARSAAARRPGGRLVAHAGLHRKRRCVPEAVVDALQVGVVGLHVVQVAVPAH